MQVAVVATARKLAVLCWHLIARGEDYAFQRPSLTEKKLRALGLRAGMPSRGGQKGRAASYSLKEVRRRERELAEQAEQAYRQLVADWQAKAPKREKGVAAANGRDSRGPLRGKLRGRARSPTPCTSLGGRPRPERSLAPTTRPPPSASPGDDGRPTPKTGRSRPHRRKTSP